jgi:hypothetical protein
VNHALYDGCAFAIVLVGKLAAIEPLYAELAERFCLIEAGAMSQLLMTVAGEQALGLCPIGHVDFERVRARFRVEDGSSFLHALVGGVPDV